MIFSDRRPYKQSYKRFKIKRYNGIKIISARKRFYAEHTYYKEHRSADKTPQPEKLNQNQQQHTLKLHSVAHFKAGLRIA